MKNIIVYEHAEHVGMNPEKAFFRYCLLRQLSLLRFSAGRFLASFLFFFRLINRENYLARSWRFLPKVKKREERLARFWAKRKRRFLKPEGETVLLSGHPARFLEPMAALRGCGLLANRYDEDGGRFEAYLPLTELCERAGPGRVFDRPRSRLKDSAGELVPAYEGRSFETAGAYYRHLALRAAWHALVLLAAGCALGGFSLFFATGSFGFEMFKLYLHNGAILALNLLPPVLLIFLLYFLTNSVWLSSLITGALTVLLTLINYFKILFRNDPFIAEDVTLFFESLEIGTQYNIALNIRTTVYLIAVAAVALVCFRAARGRVKSAYPRVAGLILTAAAMALSFNLLYLSDDIYNVTTDNPELISKWSDNQKFISKGFIYPFLHSIKNNIDTAPPGYDDKQAAQALAAYTYSDIPENEKVDVITIMLEAYNDFSQFNELEFAVDVYEEFHKLQEEGYSGRLVTDIFAGNTIVTERSFITGFTELGNFRHLTNSYAYYFREQGYYAEGAHGCFAWFYNRENVNENLGFENYWFVENYYAPSSYGNVAPDYLFMPSLIELYEAAKAGNGKPYFSFNVSYQGHGPYDRDTLNGGEYIVNKGYSGETYNIINNYLDLQYDTNRYLAELFDYFRESERPVVLVIFGDHNPWLGDANSAYTELGINIDLSAPEGFYNYYSTPYIIWGNQAAKDALGSDIQGEGPDISPAFLMNELFNLFGWEGNEFMKLSNELYDRFTVVHSTGVFCEGGALTTEPENRSFYDEYRKLEYYWLKHFVFRE